MLCRCRSATVPATCARTLNCRSFAGIACALHQARASLVVLRIKSALVTCLGCHPTTPSSHSSVTLSDSSVTPVTLAATGALDPPPHQAQPEAPEGSDACLIPRPLPARLLWQHASPTCARSEAGSFVSSAASTVAQPAALPGGRWLCPTGGGSVPLEVALSPPPLTRRVHRVHCTVQAQAHDHHTRCIAVAGAGQQ
jgi:hypothetical protein